MEDWTSTTTTTTLTTPTITWDSTSPMTITWNPATTGYIRVVPQFNPAPPSNEMPPWDEVEENDFYVPAKRAINVK